MLLSHYIKEDTARKRNGLIQFMNNAENNLIHDWSKQRDPNSYDFKDFSKEPTMLLCDWTNAYQYHSLNKDIIKYKLNETTYYCMNQGDKVELSQRDCKNISISSMSSVGDHLMN